MKTILLALALMSSVASAQGTRQDKEITALKGHLENDMADARATRAKIKTARAKVSAAKKAERAAKRLARAKAKREARDAKDMANPLCQDADRDECRAILERATASNDMQDD